MAVNMLGGFLYFLVVATAELQCLGYFRSVCLYRYDVQSMRGLFWDWFILEISMIIMGIAGLIFFAVSVKKLEWRSGEYERPFHEMAGAMFGNPGMILFLLSGVCLFVLDML